MQTVIKPPPLAPKAKKAAEKGINIVFDIVMITASYFSAYYSGSSKDKISNWISVVTWLITITGAYYDLETGKPRKGKHPLIKGTFIVGSIFAMFLFGLTFRGQGMNSSYSMFEKRSDYIIVLGAGIKGETLTPMLQGRLDEVLRIDKSMKYEKHRTAKNVYLSPIIVTGGQGPSETIPEALAMQRYLIANGIEPDRIIMEDKSRNTRQNLIFARNLIFQEEEKTGIKKDVVQITLVTSDFHMYRSNGIATDEGFHVVKSRSSSVDLKKRLIAHPREMLSIMKYWFEKVFIYD